MRWFLSLWAACAFAFSACGDATAIERLLNSRTSGAPGVYARAAEEVAADARKGKVLQGFVLALVSRESGAPPAAQLDDETRALYLAAGRGPIERLAREKGNSLAWYLLAIDTSDTNLLRRAADLGNVQALNAWGSLSVDVAMNDAASAADAKARLKSAFGYFKRAAGTGDANGLYNLGMCWWRGIGVTADPARAFDYFRAAAEKGHPEAINNIGGFFREGTVVDKDPEMSAQWFAKSASYGNPYGQFNYALALRRGEGVKRNPEEAVRYLRLAVGGGCIEAANTLGIVLCAGEGCEADPEEGVNLLRQAAAAGFVPAMENLATCYERGQGVPKDPNKVLEWKVRSKAARGDKAAQEWVKKNLKKDEHEESK